MRVVLLQGHADVVLQVEGGLGVAGLGFEIHDQVVLDGEDGVNVQVGVVAGVDLVDDGGVIGVGDHEVDVGGAHGRTVHEVEEDTGGTVGGQGVRGRVVAVPVELALLVGLELAAQVVFGLVRVLEVVLPVGGGLPDVEDGTSDGLAGLHVAEDTVHVGDLAVGVGVLDDAVAQRAEGSIGRPEGAENDVGGWGQTLLRDDFVGNLVDEGFQADHVTDTVTLVSNGGADPANGVDELDAHHPLGRGELNLTSKVVDMTDERSQNLTSPRGGLGTHGVDHIGREVGVEAGVGRHGGL